MVPRPFFIIGFALFVGARLFSATSAEKMNALLTNSPFGTPKSGAGAGLAAGSEPLEFRAVLEENGSKYFSIYDPATRRSNWVEINDPVNGFSVKGYDSGKETITVDYQGKALTLGIKRAPAVAQAMPQPQPAPVPMPPGGVPQPGTNGQMTQAGPTVIDQQRIQQIQEEIRRRRALRSQSMVPGSIPGAPSNYSGVPMPQPTNPPGPQAQPPRN